MDSSLTELDPNALYIASLGADDGPTLDVALRALEESVGDFRNVPPQFAARVRADMARKVQDLQTRFLAPAEVREVHARILTVHMTPEELADVAAFARTPAGRHFLADRSKINADLVAFIVARQGAMLDELLPWVMSYVDRLTGPSVD